MRCEKLNCGRLSVPPARTRFRTDLQNEIEAWLSESTHGKGCSDDCGISSHLQEVTENNAEWEGNHCCNIFHTADSLPIANRRDAQWRMSDLSDNDIGREDLNSQPPNTAARKQDAFATHHGRRRRDHCVLGAIVLA